LFAPHLFFNELVYMLPNIDVATLREGSVLGKGIGRIAKE
jgi:hypothetical protein